MHRPEFRKLIDEVSIDLGIKTIHFLDNWAIRLIKGNVTKFIVGYTLPLNNSTCLKIARSKDLCSEILAHNNIPNVPHQVLYCPSVLERRKIDQGNGEIIRNFIVENGFPFLIKKNDSSKGEGVYLIYNERELETVLYKLYATESTICLSPFRQNIREYRNIILDGRCLLSYEKIIPSIIGDGKSSIIRLLSQFSEKNNDIRKNPEKFFDNSLMKDLTLIPKENEIVYLQWKHNRFPGTRYEMVDNCEMKELAIRAANAIDARFASVDIIQLENNGFEIMEINATVSIHFPIYSPLTLEIIKKEKEIYKLAINEIFV